MLTVVLDVGKTIAKLSLWRDDGTMLARETRANARLAGTLDVDGIETWLAETLERFAQAGPIGAIIPVGHGAAAVIVRDGTVAAPPVDYEASIPAALRTEYDAVRNDFALTGSPALPQGLNLGAQLFGQAQAQPGLFAPGTMILLWPQYWAWRLCGVAASEVTNLGCHTDLWRPAESAPSALAISQGWAQCLPPLRHARDVLGTLTPEWCARTGLPASVRVHCGLHDSNAALLAARSFAEIAGHEATILSTGTWFVAMRSPWIPFDIASLREARDCLVNVDADGCSIPSARFMGGREIEVLAGPDGIDAASDQPAQIAAVAALIASRSVVLPSHAPGVGPFPQHKGRWIGEPSDTPARHAAISLYAALVADAALDLIGARERLLIEGRFAAAQVFVRALASLRPEMSVYVTDAGIDAAYGALRLVHPALPAAGQLTRVEPLAADMASYKIYWHQNVAAMAA